MALSLGNRLPSLQPYTAPDVGYLALKLGQQVTIEYIGGKEEPDWLYGSSDGKSGWFPKYCVLNAPRSPPPPLPPPPPPEATEANEVMAALATLDDVELEIVLQRELNRRPNLHIKIVPVESTHAVLPSFSSPEIVPEKDQAVKRNGLPALPPPAELKEGSDFPDEPETTQKPDKPKEPIQPRKPEMPQKPEKREKALKEKSEKPDSWEASNTTNPSVKRTFCKFWQENKCTKGDACTFAHGDHEIGQPIYSDGWAPTAKGGNDLAGVSRKKIMCKFWQDGKCSKGPGCTFAHGEQEIGQPINTEMARLFASRRSDLSSCIKSTPCKFWQEGKCTKGDACTFSHGSPDAPSAWEDSRDK
mmetsp:Transcript_20775/g.48574  ORF Transcript_20775/g.48574 Transcript_20775/m.48574 type:complete len:359 (-) Transcript_20775:108-1184(-)